MNGRLDSSFAYTIPARGTIRMVTGNASGETQAGSVRVILRRERGVPSVTALYSYVQRGFTVTESSISALPMTNSYRIYTESSGAAGQPGAIQPAIAIANPLSTPLAVNLEVRRLQNGAAMAARTVTIPGGGQMSRFMHELFPELPQTYRATLEVSASSGFAVAGLRGRYNERDDFLISTTPPSAGGLASAGAPLMVPHVVSGDGYSTDLVLFSPTVGSISGTIFFRTQDGVLQSSDRFQRQP